MDASDRTNAMAKWMWDARARRLPYRNLPDDLKPASLREAYAAQEAYTGWPSRSMARSAAPRSPPPPR
jgi:hypothetical protein